MGGPSRAADRPRNDLLSDRYSALLAILSRLPPETAHRATVLGLKMGFGPRWQANDPILATDLWNLEFPNPIGLAAGFDKEAEVVDALLACGFGFVEAGTVTPMPQVGNPKPRLFRLREDGAVINRLGFNSGGLAGFVGRLARRRGTGIVGANFGKNRETADAGSDYVIGVEALAPHVDYLTVNVSSPNTPGLRALQGRAALERLLRRALDARSRVVPENPPPLVIKIAPDLGADELADIAAVALDTDIDGIIIGNTTTARPPTLASGDAAEAGGLSGTPLFSPSTAVLAELYRLTDGQVPLIGCGGVASGADAYVKIRAGASLVQLYTALIFHGPGLIQTILRDLAVLLRRDGFTSVADAVGADVELPRLAPVKVNRI